MSRSLAEVDTKEMSTHASTHAINLSYTYQRPLEEAFMLRLVEQSAALLCLPGFSCFSLPKHLHPTS